MGYIEKIEGNNSLKAGVGMNVNELKKIIESGEKINVDSKRISVKELRANSSNIMVVLDGGERIRRK